MPGLDGAREEATNTDRAVMQRPDVLVVGLGPAGARAAAVAAAAGCRVLGIDRRTTIGEPVQCAEFVSAALTVNGMDWGAVSAQGINGMITRVENKTPENTSGFVGRMISRRLFDQHLASHAATCGAQLVLGVAATGVFTDGRVRLSDGSTLRPRALVGADGPRSRVGAVIGQVNAELVVARQVTVRLDSPHDATDIFLRAAYHGGYGWLFPKGRDANLGVGVEYRSRRRLKTLLGGLQAELTSAGRVSATRAVTLTGGLIPVGGRLGASAHLGPVPVALAGDAAGLTNPVTGAGIEAAICSGELAGRAVVEWLGGSGTALRDYEEELADLYDAAYARARRHRREVLCCASASSLRRSWISSPEYWA